MTSYAITIGRSPIPEDLLPGGHVAILSEAPDLDGFHGRRSGLEFRDSIAVLSPGMTRFVLLFRKPVALGTVAEQVLATGTGGINIDACRVKHSSKADFDKHKEHVERIKEKGGQWGDSWKNSSDLSGASDVKEGGRWPPNVLMVHGPKCRRAGTRKIKAISGGSTVVRNPRDIAKGEDWFGHGNVQPQPQRKGQGDADGLETVAAWECQEDCPVRLLDEQSVERGMHSAGSSRAYVSSIVEPGFNKNWSSTPYGGMRHGDSGGASRFFPQFKDDFELVDWVRKLLKSERVDSGPNRE